jgi:hypothetical protein
MRIPMMGFGGILPRRFIQMLIICSKRLERHIIFFQIPAR